MCVYVYMWMCVYVYMCICVYVCVYMYMYMSYVYVACIPYTLRICMRVYMYYTSMSILSMSMSMSISLLFLIHIHSSCKLLFAPPPPLTSHMTQMQSVYPECLLSCTSAQRWSGAYPTSAYAYGMKAPIDKHTRTHSSHQTSDHQLTLHVWMLGP